MGGVIQEVASGVDKRKSRTDPAQDMKSALDRYLSGGYQDAWDIITGMSDEQKRAAVQDSNYTRLMKRISVALNMDIPGQLTTKDIGGK
jgi:cytochrome oxidase Cu insertion factor (SCO1/SenC/PrrC family)